ncbi:hypothetical protein BO86DRAFT_161430 [Aspergillus japonicus CBS 114.51]|uniref:Uncharacterized protein n=1 Tax=Aspergillus japonicus CBS 114.51 TaxID=1448312 RepID=A0A8T8XBI6_ASPJA|nr:hypothetical protein BO86DRAFT_161430 [Aspergillus japonicus CBS 114.51]RAH85593.1 hypothetical protein BO86DRAFT_161430 [Aspergillus japonicus CBS 114.51]
MAVQNSFERVEVAMLNGMILPACLPIYLPPSYLLSSPPHLSVWVLNRRTLFVNLSGRTEMLVSAPLLPILFPGYKARYTHSTSSPSHTQSPTIQRNKYSTILIRPIYIQICRTKKTRIRHSNRLRTLDHQEKRITYKNTS